MVIRNYVFGAYIYTLLNYIIKKLTYNIYKIIISVMLFRGVVK